MDFKQLPLLCIDLIIADLRLEGIIRRSCDIVCDCIALSVTSKDVRTYLSIPFAYALSPLNDFEKLSSASTKTELQQACRINSLRVGGRKEILLQRLQSSLDDPRNTRSNFGKKFIRSAMHARARKFHRYEAVEILEKLGLSPKLLTKTHGMWYDTFHGFVKTLLIPYDGNSQLLLDSRSRLVAERLFESDMRFIDLSAALHARGCVLRPDSEISSAYLRDSPDARSLEETVDIAEEMQFYYKMTDYSTILRSNRRRSREYDYYSDDDFGYSEGDGEGYQEYLDREEDRRSDEELNREISKTEAVNRWFRAFLAIDGNEIDEAKQRMPARIRGLFF